MKCRENTYTDQIPIRYRSDTDQIPTKPPSNTSVDTNTHNIPKQLRSNTDHVGFQARPRVAKVHRPILLRKEKRGVDPVCRFMVCRPWHAPQETLAWLTPIEYRLNTNDMPMKRRGKPHTDTIPIKYRSDTDQIPIRYRWKPPIKYVCRHNTHNIPKQLRSNTDQIPIKYIHWQNGTNNDKISTKYRYNADTIPIEYRYTAHTLVFVSFYMYTPFLQVDAPQRVSASANASWYVCIHDVCIIRGPCRPLMHSICPKSTLGEV